MRKAVSIKLDTLSKSNQKMINNWLDKQLNQQQSLATVLVHFVNSLEYKNEDIMSVEMQHLIHTKGLSSILTDDSKPVIEEPKKVSNTTKPTASASKPVHEEQSTTNTQDTDSQRPVAGEAGSNINDVGEDGKGNQEKSDVNNDTGDAADATSDGVDMTDVTDTSIPNSNNSNEVVSIVEEVDESLYDND